MSLWVTLDCAGSQSSLPSYNEATEEPAKKKIIPVQSDFESSPSPEDPSSPLPSPPLYHKNRSNTNLKILFEYHGQICSQLMIDRFRMSQSTMNLARHDSGEVSKSAPKLTTFSVSEAFPNICRLVAFSCKPVKMLIATNSRLFSNRAYHRYISFTQYHMTIEYPFNSVSKNSI